MYTYTVWRILKHSEFSNKLDAVFISKLISNMYIYIYLFKLDAAFISKLILNIYIYIFKINLKISTPYNLLVNAKCFFGMF
jgi:hypothetical protein